MIRNPNIRLFLMVACSSLASQIYVNMFVDGFIVSMSVVVMSIFLYLFKDLNSVLACFLIGIFSPLFRLLIMTAGEIDFSKAAKLVLPDIAFFFAYALFFGIIFRFLGYSQGRYYIRIALCDFLSNCVEMGVRLCIFKEIFTPERLYGLILLAIIRSFVVLLVCISVDLYISLLERSEHEKNYKKLILMAASFNSEVYFMEKNMNEIEDVMKNAFTLYKTLERENYPKSYQRVALEISKDIHEIKKGYRRVIKGLEQNFINEFNDNPLSLLDIFKILSVDVDAHIKEYNKNIRFTYSYQTNYIIEKHFSFMSILRNLVSNSLDALFQEHGSGGQINIKCFDKEIDSKKFSIITVSDNGPGIPDDLIPVLFEPGFSTKMNFDTGDINRGLGLTLVKDLLSDKFQGTINVVSTIGRGTTFTLTIPVDSLTSNLISDDQA